MSLSSIRAKLMAQENRSQQNQTQATGDNAIYAFWNMPENSTAQIRFLPDGDVNNSYFWVERAMIKLPFNGIKGQTDQRQQIVQVPCMEMYGENCPILAEVRTWYKDESLKETANKYWKKRTYLFQGFVRQSPLEEKVPENPIRRFVISPQIFGIIKSSLMDTEIEELPTDYVRGLDFKIVKGKKGDYADYSTSGWARKESALTEVEQAALEAHNLFNLRDFLPKKPSEAEMRVIRELFEASIDGRPYDPDRWGAYYKPWGLQISGSEARDEVDEDSHRVKTAMKPVQQVQTKQDVSEESSVPPWEDESAKKEVKVTTPVTPSSDKAQDILQMIRARQQKV